MPSRYNTPTLMSAPTIVDAHGITAHTVMMDNTPNNGDKLNIHLSALCGVMSSLVNSFKTSAKD